ncbi:prolyl oligopeptidase family serine peptidase [bacterium]|nr:prolyl oligopeptidase family serine peptidase [bacterium]
MSYPRRNAATQRFTLGAPRTFSVSRDGQRILFCRSAAGDDPVNRLWVIDLPESEPRLLVDPIALLGSGDIELTTAEKARRERAREAGGGIVTYTTHSDHGIVVFALNGALYKTIIATGETIELDTVGGAFDPRISPNGELVAYHAAGQLRVTGADGDRLVAGEDPADSAITWGAAEFVAAEEMGRGRGFWWGPDSDSLLVARVDTSQVNQWYISEPIDASIAPRSLPYPAAGTTNATVDLFIIGLDGSQTPVDWSGREFEYLARADWTSRNGIWLTVQPRDQKTTAIVAVDDRSGDVTELHRDVDPGWSELVTGAPRRFGDRLLTVADDHETDTRRLSVDGEPVSPAGIQLRSIVSVSATHAIVGATDDATELHVFEIALDGSETIALTTTAGIHRCVAGGDTKVVTSSTMLDTSSVTTVHAHGATFKIESFAERPDLEFDVNFHISTPRALNSAVITPANHDGGLLPVLLDPYGGPHALRVQKARSAFSASQWFADQGFVVIVTDGSGTPARGPKFEQEVLGNMADPVLDDQVEALHALARQHEGLMDLTRVGIRGWSFGGYLAALAVLKRPDVFHAAVAGAPVTDWRLYDTHYTERYLGHPDTDADAYARTDLTPLAPLLERPLMLIHGLADDNVVSAHTFKLSQALLEAGRPHQVLPLSGVSHMTPQESVAENLLKLQVAFLRDALGD